jgi:hypothetical protein
MIESFDYLKYIERSIPITQEDYHRNLYDFFGKSIGDFDCDLTRLLNGKNLSEHTHEKASRFFQEHPILTIGDMVNLYADEIYLANNICHEFQLQWPPINQLYNQYEFFVPVSLLKEKNPNKKLCALDHGSAMGWQGMLMWCFGYHVIFCDLPTKYFEFLKFQCNKANMTDIEFFEVTTDKLNLKDQKYDFINSFFVFEHILYPAEDLHEIADHLNDGGYFNLRFDFSHGGFVIPSSGVRFGGDSILWKKIIKECNLKETDFFEDHIYQKIMKG